VHAIGKATAITAGIGSQGPYGRTGGTTGNAVAVALLEVLSGIGTVKTGGAVLAGTGPSPPVPGAADQDRRGHRAVGRGRG
jgi:hypothetical protein